jgi:hypothetical protein
LFVVRVNPEKPWRSWGYWEAADRGTGDGVFLAISDDYLVGRKIADEENHVLGALLAHEPWPGTPSLPRFESTDDRLQLGVLAVLSHELGHTVFADTNADLNKQGERDEFNKVGESPGRRNQRYKCFHRDFIKTSWDHTNWRKRRWVGFGEQNRNKQRDISFDLAATRKDAANGNFAAVTDVLRKVYEVRQFASLFAAVSPEEDFADSYKYRMLSSISAPPGLTMTFPDPKDSIPDVMGYLNERRTVPDKLGCAYDLSEQAN